MPAVENFGGRVEAPGQLSIVRQRRAQCLRQTKISVQEIDVTELPGTQFRTSCAGRWRITVIRNEMRWRAIIGLQQAATQRTNSNTITRKHGRQPSKWRPASKNTHTTAHPRMRQFIQIPGKADTG